MNTLQPIQIEALKSILTDFNAFDPDKRLSLIDTLLVLETTGLHVPKTLKTPDNHPDWSFNSPESSDPGNRELADTLNQYLAETIVHAIQIKVIRTDLFFPDYMKKTYSDPQQSIHDLGIIATWISTAITIIAPQIIS